MGYYFHSTNAYLKFKETLDEEAVKKLSDFLRIEDPAHDARLYHSSKWNEMTPLEQIGELLYYEGWELDSDYDTVYFEYSKDSDADDMWKVLAPYIVADSYIDCIGEDECQWEYYFDGEKMDIRYSDEPFFPNDDDFDAVRANELLKKAICRLKESGLDENQIASMLELSSEEAGVLHRILAGK